MDYYILSLFLFYYKRYHITILDPIIPFRFIRLVAKSDFWSKNEMHMTVYEILSGDLQIPSFGPNKVTISPPNLF